MFPLACPWCGNIFQYSWWQGGTTCKTCGHPTGKGYFMHGVTHTSVATEGKIGDKFITFNIGEKDGMIEHLTLAGWNFRCNVTTGVLLEFIKWISNQDGYNPVTVTSMDFVPKKLPRTRWHWSVSFKLPLGVRPVEMVGVEWKNEMTVRPQ